MNRNLMLMLVAVLVLGVAGYVLFTQSSAPSMSPKVTQAPQEMTKEVGKPTNVVLSEQNDSGESGTATLTDKNGQLEVTLTLTGAPAGVVQPAHIHTGTCANIGGVVYPLEFPVDGKSVTTLPTSLSELSDSLPLAINVHKSGSEASVYVSCGDLVL